MVKFPWSEFFCLLVTKLLHLKSKTLHAKKCFNMVWIINVLHDYNLYTHLLGYDDDGYVNFSADFCWQISEVMNFVVQDVFTVVSSAMCSVLFWNHAWSCQWQVGYQKFQRSSCMWSCSSNRQFRALESEMKSVDIGLININLTFFQPYPCEKFINVHFGCCHVWKYILMFITIAVVCIWDQFTHTYHKLLIWNIQLQINIFKNSKYYDDFLVTCEYHDFTISMSVEKK